MYKNFFINIYFLLKCIKLIVLLLFLLYYIL